MNDNDKWTLKHRPRDFDTFFGHKEIVQSLKSKLENNSRQNIFFHGPPGTGKTTLARIYANHIYKGSQGNMLDLNASKDNGVDVVRKLVAARARANSLDGTPQIIFLDEAENMTVPAQEALRRVMEDYGNNCIFIMSTNDASAIIEPITSRFKGSRYEVGPLNNGELAELIESIATKEKVKITPVDIGRIVELSGGDARSAIDYLESFSNEGVSGEGYVNQKERFRQLLSNIEKQPSPSELLESIPLIRESELSDFLTYIIRLKHYDFDRVEQVSRVIGDADIAIQRSHNKDLHIFNMFSEVYTCLFE